jgi:hypothetical protein
MENVFLKDHRDRADDLIRWGDQLDALGAAISYLAESDKHEEMDPAVYSELGAIICEYGQAINETANEAYCVLNEFYDGGGSKLTSKLKRELGYVNHTPRTKVDLERVDKALETISISLVDLQTLTDLKGEFLNLKKRILAEMESRGKKEVSPSKAGNSES